MTRRLVSEKLRLFVYYPTRFLSLPPKLLFHFSISTLHHCRSIARALLSKTLAFLTMDDTTYTFDPDSDAFDLHSQNRSQRPRLDDDHRLLRHYDDVSDNAADNVYLVPYRWWKEVRSGEDDDHAPEGVLYSASQTEDERGSQIVLNLRKKNKDSAQLGFTGRVYALVPEPTWCRSLIRHNDFHTAAMDNVSLFGAEEFINDVFSLQIRLFVSWETNSLGVKIYQKDNVFGAFKRALNIFNSDPEPLHIWDFSGQTTQFFINDRISLPTDIRGQLNKEIVLELHLHGFSDYMKGRVWRSDDMAENFSTIDGCIGDGFKMNGDFVSPYLDSDNCLRSTLMYRRDGSLGLTGIENLGNTCFMNSAIQCLVHTPKLVDYFLGDYRKDVNYENPLGMKGELAFAFGKLLRKLWAPGVRPVAPRMFKQKLASFAPQFGGYNQHDSQELLAFLLDGLHEDLNRVKCKPYVESQDAEGCPDEEVAEDNWRNHLARNDSIIVDTFQGQYRSKLVCPVCNKVSIRFDPFMYLSLPLPLTTMRTMNVTVISTDGAALPSTFSISLPKSGRLVDLTDALSIACSLRDDETLLVAEIYMSSIYRVLDGPYDLLDSIGDVDTLVAYRLPKDFEPSDLVVFTSQEMQKRHYWSQEKIIPLVARLSAPYCGSDICNKFLNILNPFLKPSGDFFDADSGNCANEDYKNDGSSPAILDVGSTSDWAIWDDACLDNDFKFYLRDTTEAQEMNEPMVSGLPLMLRSKLPEVHVLWPDMMANKYDTSTLKNLPKVRNYGTLRREESVSLYKCLEAFLDEEPLKPENMWECPDCKTLQQAMKKLDLWKLPEILIINLKRFSYDQFIQNKLETFVDFPIYDLDLSTYVTHHSSRSSSRYTLYAISNHYGGWGGGHYTAFVHLGNGLWYEFDDARVSFVTEQMIKTSAAYLLFYRRVPDV